MRVDSECSQGIDIFDIFVYKIHTHAHAHDCVWGNFKTFTGTDYYEKMHGFKNELSFNSIFYETFEVPSCKYLVVQFCILKAWELQQDFVAEVRFFTSILYLCNFQKCNFISLIWQLYTSLKRQFNYLF